MTIQRIYTIEKTVRLILLFAVVGGMLLRAGDTTVSKTFSMPTLLNPSCILADKSQLYVVEKSTISIFKKSDLTFVKKFGREGEGPKEFKTNPVSPVILTLMKEMLAITSIGKLSYFKKDGSYVKEIRFDQGGLVYALGENLLTNIEAGDISYAFCVTNRKLEKMAELEVFGYPIDTDKKQWYMLTPQPFPVFSEDYVFLAHGTGIEINGYNSKGKRMISVKYKDEKIEVPEEFKKTCRMLVKKNPGQAMLLKWLHFPYFYPGISTFRVSDKHIYVQTFRKKGKNEAEFLVFNFKGHLVKRAYLPLEYESFDSPYSYTICDWKLYQLVDDVDKEEWIVKITNIK